MTIMSVASVLSLLVLVFVGVDVLDLLARVCHGDLALRRGDCRIDFRSGSYVLSLPGLSSGRSASASVSSALRSSSASAVSAYNGSSVASRGRRAC